MGMIGGEMADDLQPGWFRYPEYWPALELALNHAAGGLTILDAIYSEEYDKWFVELEDTSEYFGGTYYDMGYQLDGSFIRSCYKAVKEGITSWTKIKKDSCWRPKIYTP